MGSPQPTDADGRPTTAEQYAHAFLLLLTTPTAHEVDLLASRLRNLWTSAQRRQRKRGQR